MRKLILTAVMTLVMLSSTYAQSSCDDESFDQIKQNVDLVVKAWNSSGAKTLTSLFDDNFIYVSAGEPYTTKKSLLRHFTDNFLAYKNGKKNFGKLRIKYQYCRNLDVNQQLVILKYIWVSPEGEKTSDSDLFIWRRNYQGEYKIIAEFPQQA